MVALVDADGLIYFAGFGAEKKKYWAILESGDTVPFESAAALRAYEKEHEVLESGSETHLEPLSHALAIVRSKLEVIRERYGHMEVYIRSIEQKNFRDDIATVAVYKGNRGAPKPVYLPQIREYLVSRYHAIEIRDQEVDDEIGCRMTELGGKDYIICSPDKDLDQLPGKHWNYGKMVEYDIDPAEAQRWFWIQALAGDSSDNIKGCWKVGEAGATKLVDEWLSEGVPDDRIWDLICGQYMDSLGLATCPYKDRDPKEIALENAQLVYMRRERGEIWMPPGSEYLQEQKEVSLDG